jgi:hypothetical protein
LQSEAVFAKGIASATAKLRKWLFAERCLPLTLQMLPALPVLLLPWHTHLVRYQKP